MESQKYRMDPVAATEFFHQVELDQDATHAANSDLDLLLEAERRCLLDPITHELLQQARSRGLVPKGGQIHKVWLVQNLGYTGVVLDVGNEVVCAIETTNKLKKDGRHPDQAAACMSPTGFKIGDDILLQTLHIHKVLAFGKEVTVFFRLEDNQRRSTFIPSTQTSMFCNCYVIKCSSVPEATEIVGEIDRFINFRIERDDNPVISTITIQKGEQGQGIGVTLTKLPAGIFITDVEEQSVASYAQLSTGMQVLKVGSTDVKNDMSVAQVENLVDHQAGGDTFTMHVRLDQHFGRSSLTRPQVRFTRKATEQYHGKRGIVLNNQAEPDDIA
eukprot:m.101914 g.101914  ORF g.101914 m.101914 type:complete len:330 (-) comp27363_c0_seq2:451-1440(-)